jgi:hypothetical protein
MSIYNLRIRKNKLNSEEGMQRHQKHPSLLSSMQRDFRAGKMGISDDEEAETTMPDKVGAKRPHSRTSDVDLTGENSHDDCDDWLSSNTSKRSKAETDHTIFDSEVDVMSNLVDPFSQDSSNSVVAEGYEKLLVAAIDKPDGGRYTFYSSFFIYFSYFRIYNIGGYQLTLCGVNL